MELAKSSYQLPRLSRMWTHLERQAGGQSKGMGEKQKEVDKRILRGRMAALRQELEEVFLLMLMAKSGRISLNVSSFESLLVASASVAGHVHLAGRLLHRPCFMLTA